jgi:biotin synthase-related radical SAM superfamily protein
VSFRQTTMAADCTCVCGRPSHTKYTILTPSPKRDAEVANSKVSSGAAKAEQEAHGPCYSHLAASTAIPSPLTASPFFGQVAP